MQCLYREILHKNYTNSVCKEKLLIDTGELRYNQIKFLKPQAWKKYGDAINGFENILSNVQHRSIYGQIPLKALSKSHTVRTENYYRLRDVFRAVTNIYAGVFLQKQ